jgi:hypothetical protein
MGYFASSLLSPPGWRNLHIHDFSTPKSSRKTPSGELSATIGEPFATTGALLQPLHGLLCSSARWKPPSDFGYSSPSSSILLPQPSPAHPIFPHGHLRSSDLTASELTCPSARCRCFRAVVMCRHPRAAHMPPSFAPLLPFAT